MPALRPPATIIIWPCKRRTLFLARFAIQDSSILQLLRARRGLCALSRALNCAVAGPPVLLTPTPSTLSHTSPLAAPRLLSTRIRSSNHPSLLSWCPVHLHTVA